MMGPDESNAQRTFSHGALQGKVAVVTGAARGIGRATAVAFAEAGASVVGIDICAIVDPRSGVEPATPEDLTVTGKLVQSHGAKWHQIILDQRDRAALKRVAAEIESSSGPVDIYSQTRAFSSSIRCWRWRTRTATSR